LSSSPRFRQRANDKLGPDMAAVGHDRGTALAAALKGIGTQISTQAWRGQHRSTCSKHKAGRDVSAYDRSALDRHAAGTEHCIHRQSEPSQSLCVHMPSRPNSVCACVCTGVRAHACVCQLESLLAAERVRSVDSDSDPSESAAPPARTLSSCETRWASLTDSARSFFFLCQSPRNCSGLCAFIVSIAPDFSVFRRKNKNVVLYASSVAEHSLLCAGAIWMMRIMFVSWMTKKGMSYHSHR
jgi:hypothetical protein